jgi:tRNA(His) guanylyltransferase
MIQGTASAQKHELLHTKFGINYNQVSERYRKGSVLVRDVVQVWPLLSRSRTNLPGEISSQPNLAQSSNGDTNTAASADHTAEALDVDARDTNPHVKGSKLKTRMELHMLHCDIISDEFWAARPWLL